MRTHELKCWKPYFQAIFEGRKRFEYRKDDRGFEIDDVLHLVEVDPPSGYAYAIEYAACAKTGRTFDVVVTSIVRPENIVPAMRTTPIPDSHCIMGIAPLRKFDHSELGIPDPAECQCPICGGTGLEIASEEVITTGAGKGDYRCPRCGARGHVGEAYNPSPIGLHYCCWKPGKR